MKCGVYNGKPSNTRRHLQLFQLLTLAFCMTPRITVFSSSENWLRSISRSAKYGSFKISSATAILAGAVLWRTRFRVYQYSLLSGVVRGLLSRHLHATIGGFILTSFVYILPSLRVYDQKFIIL